MNFVATSTREQRDPRSDRNRDGFTFPDLMVVLAVLAVLVAVALPLASRANATARKAQCLENLHQVTRAVLLYASEHKGTLPDADPRPSRPDWWANKPWWGYKSLVKSYVGLLGESSPRDKVFACPNDRGYDEGGPFCLSKKYDYQSYVFNGVNLPGVPNIAGWRLNAVKTPAKTLLVMEFPAHAPLSWHDSKTGNKNHPFYPDAESVVGFADGQVNYIRIYYDGVNPAYTRDPIPGYDYRYSGD
jgi:prepilin-type N-terminal cleavage/methylation domain-containing protein